MPTYEYECDACQHRLEAFQKMSDAPLKRCPKCGKQKLQRLISATAFQLKGGGWYKDLYSSSKPETAKSESKSDTKAESKTDTKSESKTETKSDKPKSDKKADKKTAA